jgi:hypothetical protein
MRSKLIVILVAVAALASSAVAQVGGNDWTQLGGVWTFTPTDGRAPYQYRILYSPSATTRDGDTVSITTDMVRQDGTATKFFRYRLNCRTHEYTFALYDISVTPASLGNFSATKTILPDSPGALVEPLVCK